MSLTEVARFHTLSEAEVAVSLLRSAGIPATIADVHYGSVFWMSQSALGGYRLSVPSEDLPDSVDILRSPSPVEPVDEEPKDELTAPRRALAVALFFTLGSAGAWLATRRRGGATILEAGAGTLLSLAIVFVVVVGLLARFQILTNPP